MLRSLSQLIVLVVIFVAINFLHDLRGQPGNAVALAGGALLLTGVFAGKVANGFGLPKITGYLLIGILLGPNVFGLIPQEGAAGLDVFKGLAASLIALLAGTELHLSLIRRVGWKVARLCVLVSIAVFAVSVAACLLLRPLLPFLRALDGTQSVAVAALVSSVIVSFSPTVTIAIVQENRAHGPFTEFLMAAVILGDLVVLILFSLSTAWVKASLSGALDLRDLAEKIGWETFGSVGIGAGLGLLVQQFLRRVRRNVPFFLGLLSFVCAEASAYFHLSPMLLSVAAGALIANIDERAAIQLNRAAELAQLPVFALFFLPPEPVCTSRCSRLSGRWCCFAATGNNLCGQHQAGTGRFAGGASVSLDGIDLPGRRYFWIGNFDQPGLSHVRAPDRAIDCRDDRHSRVDRTAAGPSRAAERRRNSPRNRKLKQVVAPAHGRPRRS